jgi:hypothetical protein
MSTAFQTSDPETAALVARCNRLLADAAELVAERIRNSARLHDTISWSGTTLSLTTSHEGEHGHEPVA